MKSFRGTLDELGAKTVAKYRRSNMTITCKVFNGMYFMQFHNGRQSATTRYTEDRDEANAWIKRQISEGFKRVF